MNPTDPNQQNPTEDPMRKVHNPLAVMQPGEQVICEIKRHPIGLVGIYSSAAFLLVVLAIGIFILGPQFLTNYSASQIYQTGGLAFVIITAFTLIFTYAASIVYNGNRWVVTTDSVTQITQTGLFAKQSSQLSMANLEDITAEQNGILTHIFNYGLLKAETAGEHAKFHFFFCPNPNYYAQCILKAREDFEQNNYRTPESQNRPLTTQFQNPQPQDQNQQNTSPPPQQQ